MLNYVQKGQGPSIVLLHGIAGSARYWDDYIDELSKTHRVIALDLLGFGRSPKPNIEYTMVEHTQAILSTLDKIKLSGKYILAGHSMGAIIALNIAANNPDQISKLVLINLPLYVSPAEAKKAITKSKLRFRLTYYGPSSWLLCNTWCRFLRPISRRAAKYYLPKFPSQVAEDSVLHTWRSFNSSLKNIIENQKATDQLANLKIQSYLVSGKNDSLVAQKNIDQLELAPNIKKLSLAGGHNLPLENHDRIIWIIDQK